MQIGAKSLTGVIYLGCSAEKEIKLISRLSLPKSEVKTEIKNWKSGFYGKILEFQIFNNNLRKKTSTKTNKYWSLDLLIDVDLLINVKCQLKKKLFITILNVRYICKSIVEGYIT